MKKETFILNTDLDEKTQSLTDEEVGQVFRKILKYVKEETVPKLTDKLEIVFEFIKVDIDKNIKKYKETCEKRRQAINNRWDSKEDTKDTNVYNCTDTIKNDYDNEIHNHTHIHNHLDLEEKKDNRGMGEEEKKETFNGTVKASKHKYGEYNNVLLKDEELQALKEAYSNYQELIDFLSEYIERKGYKAKSHYLCIKKWVVDAVKEENLKKQKTQKQEKPTEWFNEKIAEEKMTEEEQAEAEKILKELGE